MALIEGKVGPVIAADQTINELRQGRSAESMVADAHGRYQEAAYRDGLWHAAAQAAISLGAGLSATSVWSLYNPPGSGVYLALVDFRFAFSAAPAAAAVVFLTGPGAAGQAVPTGLTKLTNWSNGKLGVNLAGSKGQVYTAATLAAAPIIVTVLGSVVAAASITPSPLGGDLGSMILIPPGSHVTLQASAAASGFPSMAWEEIAL